VLVAPIPISPMVRPTRSAIRPPAQTAHARRARAHHRRASAASCSSRPCPSRRWLGRLVPCCPRQSIPFCVMDSAGSGASRPWPPSRCLGRLMLVAPVPISPMARPAHRSRLPACADRHASSGAVSLRPRAHATCPLRVPQSSCAHAMCTLPRAPAAHPSHMIRPLLLAARAGPALAPGALLWRACRATTRHVLAPRALATCSRHAHRLSRAQLGSLTQPGSLTHSSACWYS
jgi:hypothetical protein